MSIYLIAVIQGIVEGLTEFIPVSSTGHLILSGALLGVPETETMKFFSVFIQLGAILAVAILYYQRILNLFGLGKVAPEAGGDVGVAPTSGTLNLFHIALAMAPAVVAGLLFHKKIKLFLFSPKTVLVGLVAGGILLILAERRQPQVTSRSLDELTYKQALIIGFFQCLALWPGFSRSGATIAGGLLCGTNHRTAADFSFLVAIPMMCAASGLDLVKNYQHLSASDLGFFSVGFGVSFVVALVAVHFFMRILETVKLTPFAYYRFLVAALYGAYLLK
jgi:undecaprenyl-diphosphatase